MKSANQALSTISAALATLLIAAQAPAQDSVRVDVTADHESARLERLRGRHWEPMCIAPCSAQLDPSFSYRIAGPRLVPSAPFRLFPDRSHATVDAEVGTRRGRVVGAILGAGGGLVFVNGLTALLGGLLLSESDDPEADDLGETLTVAGGVATGIGAVAGIAGLVMLLNNWETDVTVARQPEPSLNLGSGFALTPRGFVF